MSLSLFALYFKKLASFKKQLCLCKKAHTIFTVQQLCRRTGSRSIFVSSYPFTTLGSLQFPCWIALPKIMWKETNLRVPFKVTATENRVWADGECLPRQISRNTTLQSAWGLSYLRNLANYSLNKRAAHITRRPQESTCPEQPKITFSIIMSI